MALTNLASLDNVKNRIVAEKGIACFQYLQVKQAGEPPLLPLPDLLSGDAEWSGPVLFVVESEEA